MDIIKKILDKNRRRLIGILSKIETRESPPGWEKIADIAVGGMTDLGLSKVSSHLLIISGQGRGVLDCNSGEKAA